MNVSSAISSKALPSSFYWAMRLLPREQREAMFVLYAFCRDVDDIADSDLAEREKHNRLVTWRFRIDDILDGTEAAGQGDPFSRTVQAYGLARADMMAVIDGMVIDSNAQVRMATREALDTYMDKVASAVGRLSNQICGLKGDAANRLAHDLGRALQLTNILRDLAEDAGRNRLYLPQTTLAEYDIASDDPAAAINDPRTASVLHRLVGEARDHFAAADALLENMDRRQSRPARIMKAVYARLLDKIVAHGWPAREKPIHLNAVEKLITVLGAVL